MADKKNIAILVQKLYGGGAERTAANLSMSLQDRYNVHLIVFNGSDIKYPYGGTLHDLKLPASKNKLNRIRTFFKRVPAVKKIKQSENISVTISLMPGANLVNVRTRTGDKIITSIRNQMSQSRAKSAMEKWWAKTQIRYTSKRSDLVVTLSDGVRDDLIKSFGINGDIIRTIYNPCDGDVLREAAEANREAASEVGPNSITTMGRLLDQKGQWHLIRAMSEVVKTVSDAKLYILGEGHLREPLLKLVSDMGLSSNVEFMGFLEAPHAYVMNSSVFVLPSLYEGLGNVILESMSCGVPCICTDCLSGPREILAPGTAYKETLTDIEYAEYGVLVSVGDKGHFNSSDPLTDAERQMASAIVAMLTDKDLHDRYVVRSLERVRAFAPEAISSKWAEVIESNGT